ncbi:TlpA family protein disulfide reductase [Aquimarina rubra]|uniref:TlpA family protein disulfide reductase n=1 Tax=Aquimarina rubra TaxID=1920033 RepID=A0ABW5LJ29_9FLAO
MYFFKIKYCICISIVGFCLLSCDSETEVAKDYIYFGGEIVNPHTDYIVLFKDNKQKDTIYLDKNNQFSHRVEGLKEGLYSFRHNPEYQLVLLEKGDSILLRLNTLEFDESLVFTGRGSRKNNFLIDMFLQNELEREDLEKRRVKQTPRQFKKEQDSLYNIRLKRFNSLTDKYEFSDLSKKICKSSFEYDFYSRYEMFLYRYQYSKMKNMDASIGFPEDFFDYKKQLNFNDDDLMRLYSYNRFLNHYFTNSSYTKYMNQKSFSKSKVEYTLYKLDLVDSMIQHSYIKNNLLRGITTNFILDNKNDYTSQKVLNHYLSISSDEKFQTELVKLAKSTARLKPDNIIPDQDLISSNGEMTKLSSLFEKPVTALYFWSIERKDHYIKAHKKTNYLSKIYPEIDFIGINTDDEQTDNWLKTIKRHNYNLDREYEFKFPKCSSDELVIHYTNKVILVDQDGKIINPNADLFSPFFEKQLMNYSSLATIQKQKTVLD